LFLGLENNGIVFRVRKPRRGRGGKQWDYRCHVLRLKTIVTMQMKFTLTGI